MVNEKVLGLLRVQVGHELANEIFYRKAGSKLLKQGWEGFAAFMKSQADGEHDHAMGFLGYIEDSNEEVGSIKVDDVVCGDKLDDIMKIVMEREKMTTEMIYKIYDEGDLDTKEFTLKYIKEQVEEINIVQTIIDKIKLVGDDKVGLMLIDHGFVCNKK